jgi:AraC-like DNA-binding protein
VKLNINGMVSLRCILFVKAILDELSVTYEVVKLGEVDLREALSSAQREALNMRLSNIGLELIETRKTMLAEKIKNVIMEMVQQETDQLRKKHSEHISQRVNLAYGYLSKIFKDAFGMSVEQFIIQQRIEKAKAMLAGDQLKVSEVAWQLHYSSVQHFSYQFTKITGHTPSRFKRLAQSHRQIHSESN